MDKSQVIKNWQQEQREDIEKAFDRAVRNEISRIVGLSEQLNDAKKTLSELKLVYPPELTLEELLT